MQLANCHVRLAGDMANEIFKARVTPAEVLVLRRLHGNDSVVKLQPLGSDKRQHGNELERLKTEYGPKIVSEAFPGAYPQLPVNYRDIGIDILADTPAQPVPVKGRGRGKGATEDTTAGAVEEEAAEEAASADTKE